MKNKTENKVKEYRTNLGITQNQLAELVGVTRLTIISLEKKKYDPSVGLALKLAKTFGCMVEDLFVVEE
ncbi:helix-turn-helix transcriptional regulator [Peribacillus sp. NPDC006672]|uniref:helix-turn-helix transcriptional regulator n=1 Tax=Peribacillus sp. NPDC006672 TaxID=3390606 RepID=UPI003D095729